MMKKYLLSSLIFGLLLYVSPTYGQSIISPFVNVSSSFSEEFTLMNIRNASETPVIVQVKLLSVSSNIKDQSFTLSIPGNGLIGINSRDLSSSAIQDFCDNTRAVKVPEGRYAVLFQEISSCVSQVPIVVSRKMPLTGDYLTVQPVLRLADGAGMVDLRSVLTGRYRARFDIGFPLSDTFVRIFYPKGIENDRISLKGFDREGKSLFFQIFLSGGVPGYLSHVWSVKNDFGPSATSGTLEFQCDKPCYIELSNIAKDSFSASYPAERLGN